MESPQNTATTLAHSGFDRGRLVGAAAIAFVVLVVIENAVFAATGAQTYDAPTEEVLAYYAAHRDAVPPAFAGTIPLAAHQKAADYTLAKARFGLLSISFTTAVLVAVSGAAGIAAPSVRAITRATPSSARASGSAGESPFPAPPAPPPRSAISLSNGALRQALPGTGGTQCTRAERCWRRGMCGRRG